MIRPVSVDDADFGEGRIAFLLIAEVLLAEGEIFSGHRHAELFDHVLNLLFGELAETVDDGDIRRPVGFHFKRFGLVQRGLTGFDWIDQMFFDFFKIGGGNLRVKCVNRCGSEDRTFLLGEELDALRGRVRPLVILAGEGFDGEKLQAIHGGEGFVINEIAVRFGEDGVFGDFRLAVRHAGKIIAFEDTERFNGFNAKVFPKSCKHMLRLDVKTRPFFNKYASYGFHES